jgi:hypothetical protein
MKSKYLNRKGMALVVVIMVIAVLSVLSVSALSVSTSENNFSINDKDSINSYAGAKTGLEVVANKIIENAATVGSLIGTTVSFADSNYDFDVSVTGNANDVVKLLSQGTFKGNTQSLSLELKNESNPAIIFENTIYSNSSLDLDKMEVSGPLQSGGTITYPEPYAYDVIEDTYVYYPPFIIPTPLTSKPSLGPTDFVGNEYSITANNYSYNTIEVDNGDTLILGNGTTPINIVVDTLTVKGDIRVNSKVKLFVKNLIDIQADGTINFGDPNNLIIFLGTPDIISPIDSDGFEPNGKLDIQAKFTFNGYIYGPAAYVDAGSGNVDISGAIICDVFDDNNNATVHFYSVTPDETGLDGIIYNFVKLKYGDN